MSSGQIGEVEAGVLTQRAHVVHDYPASPHGLGKDVSGGGGEHTRLRTLADDKPLNTPGGNASTTAPWDAGKGPVDIRVRAAGVIDSVNGEHCAAAAVVVRSSVLALAEVFMMPLELKPI